MEGFTLNFYVLFTKIVVFGQSIIDRITDWIMVGPKL